MLAPLKFFLDEFMAPVGPLANEIKVYGKPSLLSTVVEAENFKFVEVENLEFLKFFYLFHQRNKLI